MNIKDFFDTLLDLKFSEPLVKRYAPVLFVLAIAAAAVRECFQLLEAFAIGKPRVVINGLIMTPIGLLFFIIMARLLLDFLLNTSQIAKSMKRVERQAGEE
ncbi:MAG: DUF4282 domain-containing protein [Candidatus Sumerlaeota bacterium]